MSETLMPEIMDPMTGEVINGRDPDAMCEALQRIQAQVAQLRSAELSLRHALGELAMSEARTSHVVGRRFRATIERPAATWDNATLRRLWDEMPEARAYLRIERVAPALREIAALKKSNGPGVEAFREALLAAEKPSTGAPTVRVAMIDAPREPDETAHYRSELAW